MRVDNCHPMIGVYLVRLRRWLCMRQSLVQKYPNLGNEGSAASD